MHCHTDHRQTGIRSGYTLIEILLALAVMIVLMAMVSAPVMENWRDQRTGASTEDVRSLLAGTRILALDRDETWQFVFEPGGTRYLRVPHSTATEAASSTTANQGKKSGTLPPDITFGESEGVASTVESNLLAGLSDAGELSGISWSAPVLFYSDGTSTDTNFEIVDVYGNARTVSVRELTGGVTVTDGIQL